MSTPSYVDSSVRSFLVSLSERSPEPAGGAALAIAGASAAALVSLACHTAARKAGGDEEQSIVVRECHAGSDELVRRIQGLVDLDVRAYRGVRRALSGPRDGDPEQQAHYRRELDEALVEAVDIPLQLAEACLDVLDTATRTAPAVRPPVTGDLVAAIHLASAAIKGSLRNARINASTLDDAAAQHEALTRIDAITARFNRQRKETASVLAQWAPDYAEDL
ncbi:MAG: hypothetical protein Kow00129_09030 [Thermoleophilia bacterium]